MGFYIVRRTVIGVVQLVAVACGVVVGLRLLPVDPAAAMAPPFASKAEIAATRHHLGLDQPIITQLWDYANALLHRDLGTSWTTARPVGAEIVSRLPITLQLVVPSVALAVLLALLIGNAAAARPGRWVDRLALNYTLFASAQPSFFWALVALFIFFTKLGVAPAPIGLTSFDVVLPPVHTHFVVIDAIIAGDWNAFFDIVQHLEIPVGVLAFLMAGPLLKMVRQSLLMAGQSEYSLYTRISGLSPRLARAYRFRNAMAPVVTLIGVFFAASLGGVVLLESIFAFPGVAIFALQSTSKLDYPAVQGVVLVLTAIALLVYLLMDITYALLDPRVAYGRAAQ